MNSVNSVAKLFDITVKRLEPATSCVSDQDATTMPERHMWDMIFKLNPIHVSVIYQFSELAEFT